MHKACFTATLGLAFFLSLTSSSTALTLEDGSTFETELPAYTSIDKTYQYWFEKHENAIENGRKYGITEDDTKNLKKLLDSMVALDLYSNLVVVPKSAVEKEIKGLEKILNYVDKEYVSLVKMAEEKNFAAKALVRKYKLMSITLRKLRKWADSKTRALRKKPDETQALQPEEEMSALFEKLKTSFPIELDEELDELAKFTELILVKEHLERFNSDMEKWLEKPFPDRVHMKAKLFPPRNPREVALLINEISDPAIKEKFLAFLKTVGAAAEKTVVLSRYLAKKHKL